MRLDDLPADDREPPFDDADRRIAEALGRLPLPEAPADLASRVSARIGRRRLGFRSGALAAAAAVLLLAWSVWPPRPRDAAHVAEEKTNQEALVAEWDELLDEAAALPPVVVDLNILEAQRAWTSALQDIQRR